MLEKHGVGRRIVGLVVRDRRILDGLSPRALSRRLVGKRLIASRRRGKHLVAAIEDDGWLAFHFGMTGGLQPFRDPQEPPAYSRVQFDFESGEHLAYINRRMIGHVGWVEDAERFFAEEGLGPDALDRRFTVARFTQAMAAHRRDVKSVLMDQSAIAGIGNIYADEILFQARIHPLTRSDHLDRAGLLRLYRAIGAVLRKAVARGAGSERFTERLPKNYLLPRRRKGETCPRCGAPLATLKIGGRTTFLCSRCQKRVGATAAPSRPRE